MPYTLITAKGKIMTFYVRAVAELYQTFEGGVVVSAGDLKNVRLLAAA